MVLNSGSLEVVLAALYLRGGPVPERLPRQRWQALESALRTEARPLGEAESVLSKHGFWLEAASLAAPGVLAGAEPLIGEGRVVTAACPEYPRLWLQKLGAAAPPALWVRGKLPKRH